MKAHANKILYQVSHTFPEVLQNSPQDSLGPFLSLLVNVIWKGQKEFKTRRHSPTLGPGNLVECMVWQIPERNTYLIDKQL